MVSAVIAKVCGQEAALGQVDCSVCANLSSLLFLLLLLTLCLCLLQNQHWRRQWRLLCASWLQALLVLALADSL